MTSNREDTNDILQDVFAKAYRALRRFRGKSSFYTWIYSIATNMTLNFLKKRNRMQDPIREPDRSRNRYFELLRATAAQSGTSRGRYGARRRDFDE
jgi:RNA polymerase sigma factor (sigma-70 family)